MNATLYINKGFKMGYINLSNDENHLNPVMLLLIGKLSLSLSLGTLR